VWRDTMTKLKFQHPEVALDPAGHNTVLPGYSVKDSDSFTGRRSTSVVMADTAVVTCTLLSIGLQLAGMLVPGWWILPPDDHDVTFTNASTTTYGLWTTVVCVRDVCTESVTDTSGSNAWVQVTQVFETGAVAFSVLALLCYLMTSVKGGLEIYVLLRRLSVFLLAASATSVLIGMAVFLKKSSGLFRYPQHTTSGGHLDWPISFSLAAAVTSILVAVVIGVRLRREDDL
ncbi:hypothetical protein BaRGS_00028953, partial [Batillaria attramentaria]